MRQDAENTRLRGKNWMKLVLDWRHLRENYWLDLHGKWVYLRHQQETQLT